MEVVDRAEQFYCDGGHALAEVGALTGVSLKTLKRWSARHGWAEKRIETRRALREIRTKTALLREKFIEKSLGTLNARDVLAVVSMEAVARRAAVHDAKRTADPPPDGPVDAGSEADSIAALEKACHVRMNQFLADPAQLDLPSVRGLEEAVDLVRNLKARLQRSAEMNSSGAFMSGPEAEIWRKLFGRG